MDDIFKLVKSKIIEYFKDEDTGHDIGHLERVLSFAENIQKAEGGDLFIIRISAMVHDIHRILSNKYGRYVTAPESLGDVKTILLDCGISGDNLDRILEIVKYHDNKEIKDLPLEALIIQDADALDALGKIGLERTLKYCKKHNIPIANTAYSLDCEEYIPNINPISTCHYVYRTMIENGKNLTTKTALKLAEKEMQVLYDFIKENYK